MVAEFTRHEQMLKEATFREILLPLSSNVNDNVVHICRKFADLRRNIRACGSGSEGVIQYD